MGNFLPRVLDVFLAAAAAPEVVAPFWAFFMGSGNITDLEPFSIFFALLLHSRDYCLIAVASNTFEGRTLCRKLLWQRAFLAQDLFPQQQLQQQ